MGEDEALLAEAIFMNELSVASMRRNAAYVASLGAARGRRHCEQAFDDAPYEECEVWWAKQLLWFAYPPAAVPLLRAAFPGVAVIALATRRRPAWFCLVLFGTAFIVHSLRATKGKRYLSYAWPCFFAVWAIGLDGLLTWLAAQARAVIGQVFSERTASRR